jgi:colicin import membrane protein
MSYAMTADEPGGFTPAALSALVHLVLLAVLVFGLHWQSKHPDAVQVELWSQLPEVESPPRVETPPKVEPRPEAKPPPKVEQKAAIKPDIAVEREKKAPKKEAPLKFDTTSRNQQQLAQELKALQDRPRPDAQKQQASQPAAPPSPDAGYVDKIRSKIKGNVNVPSGINGNPEAIFDVIQLPTGEVLSVKLIKSSGYQLYDDAVERAILKSSPLPTPDRREDFQRELQLKFKPQE